VQECLCDPTSCHSLCMQRLTPHTTIWFAGHSSVTSTMA
jgi:hypothetical protein